MSRISADLRERLAAVVMHRMDQQEGRATTIADLYAAELERRGAPTWAIALRGASVGVAGNAAMLRREVAELLAGAEVIEEPVPQTKPEPELEPEPPKDIYPRPVFNEAAGTVSFRGHTWGPENVIGPGEFDLATPIRQAGAWVRLGPNDVGPAWVEAEDVLITGGRRHFLTFRAHRCHVVGFHFLSRPTPGDSFSSGSAIDGCSIIDCRFDRMPPRGSEHPDFIQSFNSDKRDLHIVGNRFAWHDHRFLMMSGGYDYSGLVLRENVATEQGAPGAYDVGIAGGDSPDRPTKLHRADVRGNSFPRGGYPPGDLSGIVDHHTQTGAGRTWRYWSFTGATYRLS